MSEITMNTVYDELSESKDPGVLFNNLAELIRPREVAKLLSMSISTIYDWHYRGKTRDIPSGLFLKINRSLYIRTDVLKRWITLQN